MCTYVYGSVSDLRVQVKKPRKRDRQLNKPVEKEWIQGLSSSERVKGLLVNVNAMFNVFIFMYMYATYNIIYPLFKNHI